MNVNAYRSNADLLAALLRQRRQHFIWFWVCLFTGWCLLLSHYTWEVVNPEPLSRGLVVTLATTGVSLILFAMQLASSAGEIKREALKVALEINNEEEAHETKKEHHHVDGCTAASPKPEERWR